MKRATITLPDPLADAVARMARRQRVSVSQVIREALEAHLGLDGDRPRKLAFAAVGRSGVHTTARDFEAALAAEWDDDRGR
jgi:Arc/MetJ-type ribon-helix-helix transcriptional regulator